MEGRPEDFLTLQQLAVVQEHQVKEIMEGVVTPVDLMALLIMQEQEAEEEQEAGEAPVVPDFLAPLVEEEDLVPVQISLDHMLYTLEGAEGEEHCPVLITLQE